MWNTGIFGLYNGGTQACREHMEPWNMEHGTWNFRMHEIQLDFTKNKQLHSH